MNDGYDGYDGYDLRLGWIRAAIFPMFLVDIRLI